VSAVTMAINAPSRILFTYVIMRLLYDKIYGWDKIAGMLTISMGILISNSDFSGNTSDEMLYVLLFLFGNFLNAVGLIYFDRKLRHHIVHFWNYMYTYSFTLLIFNVLLLPIELLYLKEKIFLFI
ncbi:putative transporter, partial [Trachipleistophora hominis]